MTKCPKARCMISVIAVFAFMFLFDKLFHGCSWMMEKYEETAHLWRSPDDMAHYAPWFFVRYGIMALVICCLYKKFAAGMAAGGTCEKTGIISKCTPYKTGICFGIKIGLLIGVVQASSYIWLPISGEVAIAWLVASVIQGIGVGLILTALCKKANCTV